MQTLFGPAEAIATVDTGRRGWQRYGLPLNEWPGGLVDDG